MGRVVISARAGSRLAEAASWLGARGADEQVLVLAASQAAASELIRTVACDKGAGFGWHRITLGRLAAELAKHALATRGLVPVGTLAVEALCARVIQQLHAAGKLGRLAAVAEQPGLPRALARTLNELRMAGIAEHATLDPTIAAALSALRDELARARLADRALVFELAIAEAGATNRVRLDQPLLGLPIVAIDLAIRARLEQLLLAAIAARAPDLLITLPAGDDTTEHYLGEVGLLANRVDVAIDETNSLARVQKHLFGRGRVNYADLDRSIELFSAPGESRECVEIARRVVDAAATGVPFDRMAVVLRTPNHYRSHLEEALARAGVPAYFERGTVRPDPSGRAFLALLACAAEDLSARRFGEYVSLGEVPDARDGGPPPEAPAAERWVAPDEELSPIAPADDSPVLEHRPAAIDSPVAGGTLRTPWRWERLLVEAAVIGGRDRWARRLAGLRNQLELADSETGRAVGEGNSRARQLEDLGYLERFALPLLDDLVALPREARWGEWIDRLTALATRALREPSRVLAVLSELVPMSAVGPVGLREVQRVLYPRIAELIVKPDVRRYGKLLVAPIEAIRGLALDIVFVPGLAERMFPQKVIEDPLLLDDQREGHAGLDLATRDRRVLDERLALRLAIGAASTRAVLSYPRIDLDQGRPRVPSFYGLEVLEAAEGQLPGFDELGRKAEATGASRIGWPAPADRMRAIDEAEHDLSLLEGLLRAPVAPTGVAAYLLQANPHLGRSLRFRARRWTATSWLQPDGLIAKTEPGKAALAAHAPSARSFSPTALEALAQCPYRFALRTIVKLQPREQPAAIETLSPLERGSLIHDVQYELFGELRAAGRLPIASLDDVRATLDEVLERVAARYRDDLCPAIDRVWDDGIAAISADIREWVRRMAEDGVWTPAYFELAFGPTRREVGDPASTPDPVDLGLGLALRGSIDLVERSEGFLRATDYKTGAARVKPDVVVAGGATLQPVLYALVLEKLFPQTRVAGGRLSFCTSRGEFKIVDVALDDRARHAARTLADTLAHHFDKAFFPAAPIKDGCQWCEFKPICGPYEDSRPRPKLEKEPLVQLQKLRGLP